MSKKKETYKEIRDVQKEVNFNTSILSMADQLADVISGNQEKIEKTSYSKLNKGGFTEPEPFHIESNDLSKILPNIPFEENIQSNKNANINSTNNINLIINELNNFNFDSDEKIASKEVNEILNVIRNKTSELKASRVVNNTKRFSKSAQKFFTGSYGLRVDFSILKQKFAMRAKGVFSGNEFFQLAADGDIPIGRIMRISSDYEYRDVTNEYKVSINKL